MALEAYKIGVTLQLIDKVSAGLGVITKAMGGLLKESGATQKEITALNAALNRTRSITGRGIGNTAFNGAAGSATKLSNKLTGINTKLVKMTQNANNAAGAVGGIGTGGRGKHGDGLGSFFAVYEARSLGREGMGAIGGAFNAAAQFEASAGRFRELNLGDAVNADARKFALGTKLYAVSSTQLMDTVRDLHAVLGNYGEAKEVAPILAQLNAANSIHYGGGGQIDETQSRAIQKSAELHYGKRDAATFLRELDVVQRFISGTAGAVMPTDVLAFIKTGGLAARGLSDKGFLEMEPLMQAMGASRAGTALMSLYQNLDIKRGSKKAIDEATKYGLFDKKGQLVNKSQFESETVEWLGTTFMQTLAAHGVDVKDNSKLLPIINALISNRRGADFASFSAESFDAFMRNYNVNANALGVQGTIDNANDTPIGRLANMQAQWTDAKTNFGIAALPLLIPMLTDLSEALTSLGKFAIDYPNATKGIVAAFGALSAVALVGGTLGLAVIGLGGIATALSLPVWGTLVGIAAGITLIGTAFGLFSWLADKKAEKEAWDKDHHWKQSGLFGGQWVNNDDTADGTPKFLSKATQNPDERPVYLTLNGEILGRLLDTRTGRAGDRSMRSGTAQFDPFATPSTPAYAGPLR